MKSNECQVCGRKKLDHTRLERKDCKDLLVAINDMKVKTAVVQQRLF